MDRITNVEDLRLLAKRKLPRALYEYIDSGSYDQITKRANRNDLDAIQFRQRVLIDVSGRSLETDILGTPSALPFALSPVGLSGLLAGGGRGEIFAARAAKAANIPYSLSMLSVVALEEIRDAIQQPFWFHVQPLKNREVMRSLVTRAKNADCSTLIVTVDWQVPAQIHNNIKNELTSPPKISLRSVWQYLAKPRWLYQIATAGRSLDCGNFTAELAGAREKSVGEWLANQLDDSATWEYITWLRDIWPGKLLVKGVLDPEDALRAVGVGVDGISVSNHGGTQLDGAPSAISALPTIAAAVGGKIDILFDSGIRSGHDVIKALALGAKACLVARPYLFGLGAAGEEGVAKAIALIRQELDINLALTGVRSVTDVGPQVLWPPRP